MKLMKWKPFTMTRRPERDFFGLDFFEGDSGLFQSLTDFQPAIDIYEQDGRLRVKAEMPGLSEKDVDVELKDNVLTISGEKKNEKEEKRDGYYSERSFGSFRRSFQLPDGVEAESVAATFKDGVLDIDVPLPAEKKARKIEVKA
ncbi:Hsp20/alpha crystallin family protein [bacterium]|nr:Hsp20/alpha crystallin family protein [bacterium]